MGLGDALDVTFALAICGRFAKKPPEFSFEGKLPSFVLKDSMRVADPLARNASK
jgi:hypothetical protein